MKQLKDLQKYEKNFFDSLSAEKRALPPNPTWQSDSRPRCRGGGGVEWRAVDSVFIEDICDLDVLHRRGEEFQLGGEEATFTGWICWTFIPRLQVKQAKQETKP